MTHFPKVVIIYHIYLWWAGATLIVAGYINHICVLLKLNLLVEVLFYLFCWLTPIARFSLILRIYKNMINPQHVYWFYWLYKSTTVEDGNPTAKIGKSPSDGRRHGIHQSRIFAPRHRPRPPWRWRGHGSHGSTEKKQFLGTWESQVIFPGAVFPGFSRLTGDHGSTIIPSLRRYHREFVGKCGKIKVTAAVAPLRSRRSTLPYHQPKGLPAAGRGLKSLCIYAYLSIYLSI